MFAPRCARELKFAHSFNSLNAGFTRYNATGRLVASLPIPLVYILMKTIGLPTLVTKVPISPVTRHGFGWFVLHPRPN
jgi:hypothetical protein